MRRLTLVATAMAGALLSGCGGPGTAADFAKMRDDALCASYGGDDSRRAIIRTEIDKRGLIASYEWSRVVHGDVGYGMKRCAVLAAWHKPDSIVGEGTAIEIWTFPDDRVVRFQHGAVASATDFR